LVRRAFYTVTYKLVNKGISVSTDLLIKMLNDPLFMRWTRQLRVSETETNILSFLLRVFIIIISGLKSAVRKRVVCVYAGTDWFPIWRHNAIIWVLEQVFTAECPFWRQPTFSRLLRQAVGYCRSILLCAQPAVSDNAKGI